MQEDREKLIAMLDAQVQHETRWLRRIPLLIGVLAAVVACYGYFMSYWTVMVVALFILTIGVTAQAVLWFGLWDLNKRQ
jgi:cobalamin biosynthesis protein CobD/CbiB